MSPPHERSKTMTLTERVEYESPQQRADRFGVNVETVLKQLRSGKLAGEKVGSRLWRIPLNPPVEQPANVAADPGVQEANVNRGLQRAKKETAEDALAERKAQMELQGCIDCEALQKSTAELAADLASREAKYTEDSEALTEREAEYTRASGELTERENAIKFNENWKQSLEEYHEVKQCLQTLRGNLGHLGYPASVKDGPAAIARLSRIWFKGLDNGKT